MWNNFTFANPWFTFCRNFFLHDSALCNIVIHIYYLGMQIFNVQIWPVCVECYISGPEIEVVHSIQTTYLKSQLVPDMQISKLKS